jgi:hypothetical protein
MPPVNGGRAWANRELFYEQYFTQRTAVIPRSEGIRTIDWNYIRYIDEQPVSEELYRLSADPLEEKNLLESNRKQPANMRARWQKWTEALASWERGSRWTDPS